MDRIVTGILCLLKFLHELVFLFLSHIDIHVSGISKVTLKFSGSLEGLMVLVYYSERIQIKISKGFKKMYKAESRRNHAQTSSSPLPVKMEGQSLILPAVIRDMSKYCQPGKFT